MSKNHSNPAKKLMRTLRQIRFPRLLLGFFIVIGLFLLIFEGYQLQKERATAALVRELQLDQHKLSEFLDAKNAAGQRQKPLTGRGIVICAGGNQLLINTYVSIKVLRETLRSSLPIEIFHVGPQDIGPITRTIFNEEFEGIKFIDLKEVTLPEGHRVPRKMKSYMWKILSLYLTSFEQVLLLDADSQPLRDPALLFQSTEFKDLGNLFWPDYWGAHTSEAPKEKVYSWLGLSAPWHTNPTWTCGESGQVVIDKRQHADVLEWLWFLNSHAELLYKHMLGDKDTFELAFMLAKKHHLFQRVPVHPGIPLSGPKAPVYHDNWFKERFRFQDEKTRYVRLGMLQYGPDLLPSFLHRTERTKFANWKNGNDLKTMKPHFFLPSFGPNVSAWEKRVIWNGQSLPAGMVDFEGKNCGLSTEQKAVLRALSGPTFTSSTGGRGCWYQHGGVAMLPIFPITYLGDLIMLSIWDSVAAYQHLEVKLKHKITLKDSP